MDWPGEPVPEMWILLKQETMSGGGISWAICKSAPCSRQVTAPGPHHFFTTGCLPPNQQRQSTEGITNVELKLLLAEFSHSWLYLLVSVFTGCRCCDVAFGGGFVACQEVAVWDWTADGRHHERLRQWTGQSGQYGRWWQDTRWQR